VPDDPAAQHPDEWVEIAERELDNLKKSYLGKISNDAKIDHALKATEAALKAVIWKTKKWNRWPSRKEGWRLYQHDLAAMLTELPNSILFPMRQDLEVWNSWRVLANSSLKMSRYHSKAPTDDQANEIARCARHWDKGVATWLLKTYRKMT
jgi:hypothetical protein